MNARDPLSLIDSLADDLRPVHPQHYGRGLTYALLAWGASAAVLLGALGLRADFGHGMLPPQAMLNLFWSGGLALVAQWFAIQMAMPGVGRDHGGWRWAALVALALPLAALASLIGDPVEHWHGSYPHSGLDCLWQGLVGGAAVAAALTLWLRQGAPTSPERAGLVTGLASGATGTTIVALHCPVDALMHVGIWHGATIALAAVVGRFALPPLLRW